MSDIDEVGRAERRQVGKSLWEEVLSEPVEEPSTPFQRATLEFLAAEVWAHPGLARKDRRWISLTCAGASGQGAPLRTHMAAAIRSGDITVGELEQFVLQLAAYAGWPHAALANAILQQLVAELEL